MERKVWRQDPRIPAPYGAMRLTARCGAGLLGRMDAPPDGSLRAFCPPPPEHGEVESGFFLIEPLRRQGPILLTSPHSGRRYPPDLLAQSRLDAFSLRRSEDALVDELFSGAAALGAPLLCASFARAYVDLNRAEDELDPGLISGAPLIRSWRASARVAAGLGVIPRLVGDDAPIYRGKIPYAEAEQRIAKVYRPFHAMVRRLVEDAQARAGASILIDCHSMPSHARGRDGPHVVLGDRFGSSCHPRITQILETKLQDMGYRVARNSPYAGGYITQSNGAPARGRHAIQIEIDRSLYLNEATLARSARFDSVRRDMTLLIAALQQERLDQVL